MRLNDDNLKISCSAVSGPVPLIPIRFTQAVGKFDKKSMTFSPPTAGDPADVVISFQLNRDIKKGEKIEFVLTSRTGTTEADACKPFQFMQKFTSTRGCEVFPVVYFDPFEVDQLAYLRSFQPSMQETNLLRFYANEYLEANVQVDITIPAFNDTGGFVGVRLPDCGMSTDTQILTIATNALSGPVQGMVLDTPSIGAFRETSIDYEMPRVGSESQITVKFRMTMQLVTNSIVRIDMPGFSGYSGLGKFGVISSAPCCSAVFQDGCIRAAEWIDPNSTNSSGSLVFHVRERMGYADGSHCIVQVIVPASAAIVLPQAGSEENSTSLTISTNSSDGIVDPIAIISSTGVYVEGAFRYTKVEFFMSDGGVPSAGEFAEIAVTVETKMVLVPGDLVEVRFPGFSGPADRSVENRECVLHAADCRIQHASWNQSSVSLIMTVVARVPPRTRIYYRAARPEFKIARAGVQTNDPTILISTNAAAGPTSSQPVMLTQGVGSFIDAQGEGTTALHVSPARAAPVSSRTNGICCQAHKAEPSCCVDRTTDPEVLMGSNVTLSFVPSMPLQKYDRIMFRLCGFRQVLRQDGLLQVPVLPSSFFDGFWDQEKQQLDLSAKMSIEPSKRLELMIPAGSGILPPPGGIWEKDGIVNPDRECLQAGSNATKGPIPFRRVTKIQAFGAFWNTTLDFGNPRPGITSSFMLRMVVMMPLSVGDELLIHMPDFSGASLSCEMTVATPNDDAFGNARWSGNEKIVRIAVEQDVPPGEFISIFVPSTAVVTIPLDGIHPDVSVFLSTDAVLGPVPPTKILTMPGIGHSGFLTHSQLAYGDDPRINVDLPIQFKFAYNASLYAGDRVTLRLHDFEGESASFSVSSSVTLWDLTCGTDFYGDGDCGAKDYVYPVIQEASWNATSFHLTFTVSSDIRFGTNVSVQVAADQGLRVSSMGSEPDSPLLQVKVDAEAGSQDWLPIQRSAGVGAFAELQLRFNPPQANTVSEVTLSLLNTMSLQPLPAPADQILLLLPDFQGNSTCIGYDPSEEFPFKTVCWNLDDYTFTMHVGRVVPRLSFLELKLSTAFGVKMPTDGLVKNAEKMQIAANAKLGNVALTPILNSPPIGVAHTPSLYFNPDKIGNVEKDSIRAGQPSLLSVSFVLGMAMQWQETVTLHLPGFFTCKEESFTCTKSTVASVLLTQNTQKRRFDKATWYPQTENLVMSASMPLSKGEIIEEKFRTPINLPRDGIRWYSRNMTLASSAKAGPIPPTVIPSFNPVGSMRYSELRVQPHIPGSVVAIDILFRPQQRLSKGTTIDIVLPGFSGPTRAGAEYGGDGSVVTPLPGSHPAVSRVTWVEKYTLDGSEVKPYLMTFFIDEDVHEDDLVNVSLSSAEQIKIPDQGVLPNVEADLIGLPTAAAFTMKTVQPVPFGSVAEFQFWRSPGIQHVGRIVSSEMHYDGEGGPHADELVDLTLTFTATVTLFPGDIIRLALPDFTSTPLVLEARLSYPQYRSGGFPPITRTTQANWHPNSEVLEILVNYELPGAVPATVFVSDTLD